MIILGRSSGVANDRTEDCNRTGDVKSSNMKVLPVIGRTIHITTSSSRCCPPSTLVLSLLLPAHYRWSPSRSQVLEGKAAGQIPPIIMHTELLKRRIKEYVLGVVEAEQQQEDVKLG